MNPGYRVTFEKHSKGVNFSVEVVNPDSEECLQKADDLFSKALEKAAEMERAISAA